MADVWSPIQWPPPARPSSRASRPCEDPQDEDRAMNDMFQGTRFLRAVGITLVLALLVCVPAFTQQPVEVSGRVTSQETGTPIRSVTVRVRGSSTSTVTD